MQLVGSLTEKSREGFCSDLTIKLNYKNQHDREIFVYSHLIPGQVAFFAMQVDTGSVRDRMNQVVCGDSLENPFLRDSRQQNQRRLAHHSEIMAVRCLALFSPRMYFGLLSMPKR